MPVNGELGKALRAAWKTFLPKLANSPTYACRVSVLFPQLLNDFSLGKQLGKAAGAKTTSALRLWAVEDKERDCHLLTDMSPAKRNGCVTGGFPHLCKQDSGVVRPTAFSIPSVLLLSVLLFHCTGGQGRMWS